MTTPQNSCDDNSLELLESYLNIEELPKDIFPKAIHERGMSYRDLIQILIDEDFRREIARNVAYSIGELLKNAFQRWKETGRGMEMYPLDPTDSRTWDKESMTI